MICLFVDSGVLWLFLLRFVDLAFVFAGLVCGYDGVYGVCGLRLVGLFVMFVICV